MEIVVRDVWAKNLVEEMSLIEGCLQDFPCVSIDTEFPGTVFSSPRKPHLLSPFESYAVIKRNVDALSLIQLGLTLSDAAGNLPLFGGRRHVWQFNFADFDSATQPHNPDSISLLRRQGIDFSENRRAGIHSPHFAHLFKLSGLFRRRNLTWVTFHGVYDLAYLIKILTNRPLPHHLGGFMALLRLFFGVSVLDLKPVAAAMGFHGGLEKIAVRLRVERVAGKAHQAGSDSLLTMQVLIQLIHTSAQAYSSFRFFNYHLFGLTCR